MTRSWHTTVVALFALGQACSCWAKEISLDQEDLRITEDTRVRAGVYRIVDTNDDGAIHVQGDGITVDFQGAELVGCSDKQLPDAFTGKGIVIAGKSVTLRNVKVRGYKVGIYAHDCPGLVIEDADVSGNYQQHLLSTPEAEDGSDWLFPQRNDDNEWMNNYGAGLYVQRADGVTLRRVRARNGQNGIIIDRVNGSKIYDNDCSFLSGWGLAMWRSSRNVITRNAFDFCVRGYSHGVYNRGQDSAGILMFEQNNDNVIAENSATHGGDCFFGFGGEESLSKAERTGNNGNVLANNDFSYAPAHGIEMTFSFDNKFVGNRMVGNAICGVWGGYSQNTLIAKNLFEDNGEMGYGLERGGVNIEHGADNKIIDNTFKGNKCGVHLWWDDDAALMDKPWIKKNHRGSTHNVIALNTFENNHVAVHLRVSTDTVFAANRFPGLSKEDIAKKIVTTVGSELTPADTYDENWQMPEYPVYGETHPIGARKQLAGRDKIVVTEWGPYNYQDYAVFPTHLAGGEKASLQVLGPSGSFKVSKVTGDVAVTPTEGDLPAVVTVKAPGRGLHPFGIQFEAGGKTLKADGNLLWAEWDVKFFQWQPADDPRQHEDKWKELIAGTPTDQVSVSTIDFRWGGGPPTKKVSGDHFGTVATTTLELPGGKYKIATVSDDGIRVWADDAMVIDDWTWHPPKANDEVVNLKPGRHTFRVEHFEIDGFAQLQVKLEPQE